MPEKHLQVALGFCCLLFILICNSSCSEDLSSTLEHEFNKAALELLSTYGAEEEELRHKDRMKSHQGGHDNLAIRKIVPVQKIPTSQPYDFVKFTLKNDSNEDIHLLAVANNFHPNTQLNSTVDIYKFDGNKKLFKLIHKINEIGPFKLEFMTAYAKDGRVKKFLAIAGHSKARKTTGVKARVAIYEIVLKGGMLVFQEFQNFVSINVDAMRSFTRDNLTCLVIGMRLDASMVTNYPGIVVILSYNKDRGVFQYHSTFKSPFISDIEVFNVRDRLMMSVAYYKDLNGNLDLNSSIYRFNDQKKQFEFYQGIATRGARDIEPFEVFDTYYLVVANEFGGKESMKKLDVPSAVYRLIGDKFYYYRNITTYGAVAWKSIKLPDCQRAVLLVYGDRRDNVDQVGLVVYREGYREFEKMPLSLYQSYQASFRPQPNTLALFTINNDLYLTIGNAEINVTDNTFRIDYEVTPNANIWEHIAAGLSRDLALLQENLTLIENSIRELEKEVRNVVKTNLVQNISDTKIFRKGILSDSINVEKLIMSNGSIFFSQNETLYKANPNRYDFKNLTVLETKSRIIEEKISNLNESIPLVPMINNKTELAGSMKFSSVVLATNDVSFDNITIRSCKINGIDLCYVLKDVVLNITNDVINGTKTFTNFVKIKENLKLNMNLNGFKVSEDLIDVKRDQMVESKKEFDEIGFHQSINVSGFVNGIRLESDALHLHKSENVQGRNFFVLDLKMGVVRLGKDLDGINFDEFIVDSMINHAEQNVTGNKQFKTVGNVGQDVIVKNLTNKRDLDKWSSGFINIKGPISKLAYEATFSNQFIVKGNMTIKRVLNDLKYPNDVVLINGMQQIIGNKEFTTKFSVDGNVYAEGLVDNVNASNIVSLSKDERIEGKKTFKRDIKTSGFIRVASSTTVDGVDISKLQKGTVTVKGKQNITGPVHFTTLRALDCLSVTDQIGDKKITFYHNLYERSVLHEGMQSIAGFNSFSNSIGVSNNVSLGSKINGHVFPDTFLNNFGNQKINSSLVLSAMFLGNNTSVEGLLNQVDFDDFSNNLISVNGDQRVFGMKTFIDHLQLVKNINSCCFVNNCTFKDLLTKNNEQTVTSAKSFEDLDTVKGVDTYSSNVHVKTTVDDVDLSNFTSKIQIVSPHMQMQSSLNFENVIMENGLETEIVNGYNLSYLINDIVTLQENQKVPAEKVLEILKSESNVLSNSTVDGIDISLLSGDVVKVNEDTTIEGKKKFNDVTAKGFDINGVVHGANLSQLVEKTVLKSGEYDIAGDKIIAGDFSVVGSAFVTKLNEMDPSKDFVLKHTKQNISGAKVFSGNVTWKTAVEIAGKVNGLDLSSMQKEAVLKTKDQAIKGIKVFAEDAQVEGNVTIGGNIDGIDLSELQATSVKLGSNSVLEGKLIFANAARISGDLQVLGKINGKDVRAVKNDSVMVYGKQSIKEHAYFEQVFSSLSNFSIMGNITSSGTTNRVRVSDLDKSVMKKDADETVSGQKTFKESIRIQNRIYADRLDGYQIGEFVTIDGDQAIGGRKTLSHINAAGNVSVSELADGEKLPDLAADTVLVAKSQSIIGEKVFQIIPVFENDMVCYGSVDKKVINSRNMLTLNSDQKINGTTSFLKSVSVKKDINGDGVVSGVNVTDIEQRRVTLHTKQTLNMDVFAKTFIVSGNVVVNGTVNNIDLSDWESSLAQFTQDSIRRETMLKTDLNSRCPALNYAKDNVINGAPYYIEYFEEFQSFDYSIFHMEPFSVDMQNFLAIVRSSDALKVCKPTEIMVYNNSLQRFEKIQTLSSALDAKSKSFKIKEDTYLFLENSNSGCHEQGKSYLYKWDAVTALFNVSQIFDTKSVADTSVIQSEDGSTWFVIANVEKDTLKSNVAIWQRLSNESKFYLTQTLPASMPSSIEAFKIGNNTFLAVAMSFDPVLSTTSTLSPIYKLNQASNQWELLQQIPTTRASDVKSFSDTEHHFIAFSNEQDKNTLSKFSQEVKVFKYLTMKGQFVLDHSFGSKFPMGIEKLNLDEQTKYMVIAMKESGINVYKFKLHFGYELITFISQPSITHVSSFSIDKKPVLAVASKLPSEEKPRLLKARLSGIRASEESGC